jgi:hypothetical protein
LGRSNLNSDNFISLRAFYKPGTFQILEFEGAKVMICLVLEIKMNFVNPKPINQR